MKMLIAISILAVFLIAGCTNIGSIGTTNIGDIVNSPENYYMKNITIQGEYSQALAGARFLRDEQGYNILMEGDCPGSQRTLEIGGVYKATGTIKRYERCACQERKLCGDSYTINPSDDFTLEVKTEESGWENDIMNYAGLPLVKDCEKNATDYSIQLWGCEEKITIEYRCRPDSTQITYFLECNEPMVRIDS